MLALIDESTIEDQRGLHYVIGAALVLSASDLEDSACNDLRDRLGGVVGERPRPFRWKKEGIEKRTRIFDVIVEADVFAIAAVSPPGQRFHQRRNRSLCLVQLSVQLASEGVTQLVIESRRDQDGDDTSSLLEAKKEGILPSDFPEPLFRDKSERLLWLPDAVAGAVREAEAGIDLRWMQQLTAGGGLLGVHRP